MTPAIDPTDLGAFNDALVLEIKAEMGRRDLSSRALGRLIGESSQYVSMRLDGGNPRTGKRVALSVSDLAAIASAMEVNPGVLFDRALRIALEDSVLNAGDVVLFPGKPARTHLVGSDASGERPSLEHLYDEPSAAEPLRNDVEGDEEPEFP